MSYKEAIRKTEFSKVSIHNREALSPGNAYIITENSDDSNARTIMEFFKESHVDALRDVLFTAAHPEEDKNSRFALIHSINEGDATQNTNSKMPSLHVHTYTADFAPEYAHITDPNIKSYVVRPNVNLGAIVNEIEDTTTEWGFDVLDLNGVEEGEAAYHMVLFNTAFKNFVDFADNADDRDLEEFRSNMISLVEPLNEPEAGGARIVYDKSIGANCFAISVYGGEDLARYHDRQRYFEKPKAPAPK